MSCNICGHTMQNLGLREGSNLRMFWCPRCGTLKEEYDSGGTIEFTSPKITEALTKVEQHIGLHERLYGIYLVDSFEISIIHETTDNAYYESTDSNLLNSIIGLSYKLPSIKETGNSK